MTTPRVTVPVEPTRDMILAGAEVKAMVDVYGCVGNPDEVWSAMLSAAPAPEGVAAEDLREALIQADLKIRSLPGTDQSDVEFIRAALATREEAPAEAVEDEELFAQGHNFIATCKECGVAFDAHLRGCSNVRPIALRAQPPAREDAQPVAIVPPHCTGASLAFEPGVLHVSKDGSGYIAIDEEHFSLEDDRCQGPDGPEGSVHWITRLDASEVVALRDFLTGATHPDPDALRVAVETSGFLLDRLEDLEQDVNERDFYGHVHPAASRLRQALAALQAEQGAK